MRIAAMILAAVGVVMLLVPHGFPWWVLGVVAAPAAVAAVTRPRRPARGRRAVSRWSRVRLVGARAA
jgi:hypothetical protein